MTRKHFIALAREIAKIESSHVRYAAASAVANAAIEFNPLFDRERFYDACKVVVI